MKNGFKGVYLRNYNHCIKSKPIPSLGKTKPPSSVGLGLAFSCFAGNCFYFHQNKVICEPLETQSRLGYDKENVAPEPKFDWVKFWELLRPHWCYLLIAVSVSHIFYFQKKNSINLILLFMQSAFVVAILNIEIPRMLGSMINVVSNYLSSDSRDLQNSYWEELKIPATKLAVMYIFQSAFTFTYIHTLSCVGERVASQLRQDLFSSIIQQDIAFFDTHRTGELVNRCLNITIPVKTISESFY